MKLYMFRTVLLSETRSLFTVHLAMMYVIQVCRELSSRIRVELHPDPARKRSYIIAECTVNKLLMMDRGTVRNIYSSMPE